MDLPRYHTCASPPTCRIYVHPFRNSFGLIDLCRLSQDTRLTSDSCSSGWCFAIGFLHRSRCLLRLAELLVLPLFGRTADFHRIDTRALLGALKKMADRRKTDRQQERLLPRGALNSFGELGDYYGFDTVKASPLHAGRRPQAGRPTVKRSTGSRPSPRFMPRASFS